MALIDRAAVLRRDERMIMRRCVDGWALVDPYRRTLFMLNPCARLIWELLDGRHTLGDVLCRLREEFDADDRVLEKDVRQFIGELRRREMVVG